jgi:hypothetical protein
MIDNNAMAMKGTHFCNICAKSGCLLLTGITTFSVLTGCGGGVGIAEDILCERKCEQVNVK